MMRLLESRHPDHFSLTSDLSDNDVRERPYAILSHTWGNDEEEVTFDDLLHDHLRSKAGWTKLRLCAERARRDGIQYLWIDTCCINKDKHHELSEAITSMFRWYRDAKKCYVYLADVSARIRDSEENTEPVWASAFHKSRWFTRGWTLQELLAPAIVEFYSRDGDFLGTKASLAQHIHEITTIPLAALRDVPLSTFSIAERIRWTENRQTKKEEDKAYCLLGIFDVFMPFIYGERKNALRRLQKEINDKYGANATSIWQSNESQREMLTVADWYSSADFADQQTDQLFRRQKGTGGWFLASDTYQRWRQQINGTLLCPGIPGSGKSSIVAAVVDDLQTLAETNKDVVVAYLYCNFNRQAEQDLRSILATLTRQLFQERVLLPETVTALYDKHRVRQTKPTVDELGTVFQSLVQLYSQVHIVIDALDECQNTEKQRDNLLSELFSLQQSKSSNVNILATTRPVPEIVQRFSEHPQIEIYAHQSDLEVYLANRMTTLADFVLKDSKLQEEIKSCIVSAAEGMFLLAKLQFDSLQDKTNRGRMRKAVARLSKGGHALHDEYAKTVERIEQQREGHRDLARRVLMWITYATRQLSIDELREAVAIDPEEEIVDLNDYMDDEEQIVSVCQGLVEVDRESRVIRLVHYTAQEYFETERRRWLPDGDLQVARSCLTYLSMDVFAHNQRDWGMDLNPIIQQHKFLEYAGKHWGTHARAAQHNDLQPDVLRFLSDNNYLRFSTMVTLGTFDHHGTTYKCHQSDISAIHISAHFGLDQVTQDLIRQGRDLNCKDSSLQTPLLYAADRGHTEIVKLLLALPGIEVDAEDKYSGNTSLSIAAREGHTEIVKLLLAWPDIKVNTEDKYGGDTPLSKAAREGHTEIIKLLLTQPGIEVNTQDRFGYTPLSEAAREGHTEIVKLLLTQPGIKVNTGNKYGGSTPLSIAFGRGHTEIVKLLLAQPGIEVNTEDMLSYPPLFLVAEQGHTEVVELDPNMSYNNFASTTSCG